MTSTIKLPGLDKADLFERCILFGQFGEMFLDLTPDEKLNSFNSLLQLQVWDTSADLARTRAKDKAATIQHVTHALSVESGRLEALKATLQDAQQNRVQWQLKRGNVVATINRSIREEEDNIRAVEEALSGIKLPDIQKLYDERQAAISCCAVAKTHLEQAQQAVKRAHACPTEGPCPTCFQPVSGKVLAGQLEKATAAVAQAELHCAEMERVREAAVSMVSAAELLRGRYNSLVLERSGYVRHLEALKQSLERETSEVCPYDESIAKATAKILETSHRVGPMQEQLSMLRTELAGLEFWVEAFRAVRLWVLQATLRALEIDINNVASCLGLSGWSIKLDTERKLKSGGTSLGFAVEIRSPTSDGTVGLRDCSGGELQRLRVASAVGFANLIMRKNFVADLGVEVWDEPTAHLSDGGVHELLDYLRSRAQKYGRAVFVVDHRVLDYKFDGTLHVVKQNGRSKAVWI